MRGIALVIIFGLGVAAGWYYFSYRPHNVSAATVTVYYTAVDGKTEVPYKVSLGPARDRKSVAFYAATQALAGPAADVEAIRFPAGTHLLNLDLSGDTATVDLSPEINKYQGGSFDEGAMFKALVWTLTAQPGIKEVAVRIDGSKVATLPRGHLELDEPLSRSAW